MISVLDKKPGGPVPIINLLSIITSITRRAMISLYNAEDSKAGIKKRWAASGKASRGN
jgi:hypothetical protein